MKRRSEMTWKERKLDNIKFFYGDLAEKYDNGYGDDRQVFVNLYNMIIEAIESLPDEPNNYICCAVNHSIHDDCKIMDRISNYFENRK